MEHPFPRRRLLAALVLGLAIAGASEAQPVVTSDDNAALRYNRAFLLMDEPLRDAAMEARSSLSEPDFALSPASREAMESAAPVIRTLLAGAALPSCDFGVDEIAGFNTTPPHVTPMRLASLLLLADARLHAGEGETDAAARRIAGALRMAAHFREDDLLMSSMLSLVIAEDAADVAERLLDAGALDGATRERIAGALDAFGRDDPFALREAVRREGAMRAALYRSSLDSPERLREVASILGDGDAEQEAAFLAMLNDASAPRHIGLLETAYRRALEAWDGEDPQAALRAMEDRAQSGELGPIARMSLPALRRMHKNGEDAARRLEALRRRLRP